MSSPEVKSNGAQASSTLPSSPATDSKQTLSPNLKGRTLTQAGEKRRAELFKKIFKLGGFNETPAPENLIKIFAKHFTKLSSESTTKFTIKLADEQTSGKITIIGETTKKGVNSSSPPDIAWYSDLVCWTFDEADQFVKELEQARLTLNSIADSTNQKANSSNESLRREELLNKRLKCGGFKENSDHETTTNDKGVFEVLKEHFTRL